MHALVNGFNARERANVLILETPLTYLHRDAMSAIGHREVGTDVPGLPDTGIVQGIRVGANLIAVGDVDSCGDGRGRAARGRASDAHHRCGRGPHGRRGAVVRDPAVLSGSSVRTSSGDSSASGSAPWP